MMDKYAQILQAADEYIDKFKQSPILRMAGFKEFLKDKGITVSTSDVLKAVKQKRDEIKAKYSQAKKAPQANNSQSQKAQPSSKQPAQTSQTKVEQGSLQSSRTANTSTPTNKPSNKISDADYDALWGEGKQAATQEAVSPTSKKGLAAKYGKKVLGAAGKAAKGAGIAGTVLAGASLIAEITDAYKKGGMDLVKASIKRWTAEYGGAAVGSGLGLALGSLTGNPVLAGIGTVGGGLTGAYLAGKAINGNNDANSPQTMTPEEFDEARAKTEKLLNDYAQSEKDLATEQKLHDEAKAKYDKAQAEYAALQKQVVDTAKTNSAGNGATPVQQSAPSTNQSVPVQQQGQQPVQNTTQTPAKSGAVEAENSSANKPAPTPEDVYATQLVDYLNKAQELDSQVRAQQAQSITDAYNNMLSLSGQNPYYGGQYIQPQGYNIDINKLQQALNSDAMHSRLGYYSGMTNVKPSEAQMAQNAAETLYQAQMANQAGVPYADYVKGITAQNVAKLEAEKFKLEQTLEAQYKAATNAQDRAKILGDMYTARMSYNQAIDQEKIKGLNTINNTNLVNLGNLAQSKVQGEYGLKKAETEGTYDLAQERIKQDNPFVNFKDLTTGMGNLYFSNPSAMPTVINSLPTDMQKTIFPNMTPENLQSLGRYSGQQPVAQQQGFGAKIQEWRNRLAKQDTELSANEQ